MFMILCLLSLGSKKWKYVTKNPLIPQRMVRSSMRNQQVSSAPNDVVAEVDQNNSLSQNLACSSFGVPRCI